MIKIQARFLTAAKDSKAIIDPKKSARFQLKSLPNPVVGMPKKASAYALFVKENYNKIKEKYDLTDLKSVSGKLGNAFAEDSVTKEVI